MRYFKSNISLHAYYAVNEKGDLWSVNSNRTLLHAYKTTYEQVARSFKQVTKLHLTLHGFYSVLNELNNEVL